MSDSLVVTARGLTKRYGKVTVIDGIDFDVAKGEIFGLLGPNGAGKTTTILMMLGLTNVSGGEIRVLGHNPERDPLAVKRRVGYLPDQVGFYDNLTAFDNLVYTARLMGIASRERNARITDALGRVRLADVAEKRVQTFSARHAPAARPRRDPDEARRGRDLRRADLGPRPAWRSSEFLEMIHQLKRARGASPCCCASLHLLDQVQRMCDRVALFQAGRIVLIGTVPEQSPVQVLGTGYVVEVRGRCCRRRRSRGALRRDRRRSRRRCEPGRITIAVNDEPRRAGGDRPARWSPPTELCADCRSTRRASRRSTPASSRSRRAQTKERAMRREGIALGKGSALCS